jgi:hypothetical protein
MQSYNYAQLLDYDYAAELEKCMHLLAALHVANIKLALKIRLIAPGRTV